MTLLWLLGCLPGAAPAESGLPLAGEAAERPPSWLWAAARCDTAAGAWTFEGEADAWTGGGWVWLTDGRGVVEDHRVPSVGAAPGGDADSLRLEVPIRVDFREDGGTAFGCAEPIYGVFEVDDLAGERADCGWFGLDAGEAVWARLGRPACAEPLPDGSAATGT